MSMPAILKRATGRGDRTPSFTSRLSDEAAGKVTSLKRQLAAAEAQQQRAEDERAKASDAADRENANNPHSQSRVPHALVVAVASREADVELIRRAVVIAEATLERQQKRSPSPEQLLKLEADTIRLFEDTAEVVDRILDDLLPRLANLRPEWCRSLGTLHAVHDAPLGILEASMKTGAEALRSSPSMARSRWLV